VDYATGSYVDSAIDGDEDSYDVTNLVAGGIDCLQIEATVNLQSATPTLDVGFDNGTQDLETLTGITGTAKNIRAVFNKDPSGATWTQATVNSVKAILKAVE
jgi:hypothetical protein